jgi:hypothetical protein
MNKSYQNRFLQTCLTVMSLLAMPSSAFAAAATVELLQMPAWIDSGGSVEPLRPGDAIHAGDRILTGDASRIRVLMADNSHVKLGEAGEIDFRAIEQGDAANPFTGIIDVVKGAFRYTTLKSKKVFKRDIRFHVRSISAGIRGTDIWGRSTDASNLLALIEGEITASVDGGPEFTMDQPLTFFELTPSVRTANVITVDMNTLQQWAAETETQSGAGVVGTGGQWHVNIASVRDSSNLQAFTGELHKAGYATATESVTVNGVVYTRIQVRHFLTERDARAFASAIDGRLGVIAPWVLHTQ